ncbi:diamine acetyltransferase 2-like [Bombyx mandarina]|uniref:Diamine acetyltransferase 2-like n=1 Tax=Bombyx mandarina TaxID=7092 RepID=A0A6J2K949_BOMMA|nr:diamine acetyltransferase 2-like [Bombyx mandarina]
MSNKYKSGEVIVRAATKHDMSAVAEMIQELADYEKMSDGPKLSIKDLVHDGFEKQPPVFFCKVAEKHNENILGYAIYFPVYSTWEGRALMLEDLYVRMNERRRGVGRLLFDAVAKEASATGCCRLDFHVLEWNPACSFYESKGAVNLTNKEQWCYYRLTGDALRDFAKDG